MLPLFRYAFRRPTKRMLLIAAVLTVVGIGVFGLASLVGGTSILRAVFALVVIAIIVRGAVAMTSGWSLGPPPD